MDEKVIRSLEEIRREIVETRADSRKAAQEIAQKLGFRPVNGILENSGRVSANQWWNEITDKRGRVTHIVDVSARDFSDEFPPLIAESVYSQFVKRHYRTGIGNETGRLREYISNYSKK